MFRAIGFVLSWLPAIVAAVAAVEQIFSNKPGAEKKEVVLKALRKILKSAGVEPTDSVMGTLSSVIDAIVAVLNFLGVGGFSDSTDVTQAVVDLVPTKHVEEARVSIERGAERAAKAFENDERIDELQAELEARIGAS